MRIIVVFMVFFISFACLAENHERININQADAQKLDKVLKGIGPSKAEAIVQYRKEHGAFKQLEDILNVKGIGPKTLEQNRAVLTVR